VGLEAVELVMELEDEFAISIPDDVAAYTRTLGQMHDYLLARCAGRKRIDCPTRSVFYRLRNALGSVIGVEPKSICPRTPLLPLLGRWKRKRVWSHIEQELSLSLPPLENQAGIGVFAGMAIASLSGLVAVTILTGDVFLGVVVGLCCLLPGTLVGYIVGLCVFAKPLVASLAAWSPSITRRLHHPRNQQPLTIRSGTGSATYWCGNLACRRTTCIVTLDSWKTSDCEGRLLLERLKNDSCGV